MNNTENQQKAVIYDRIAGGTSQQRADARADQQARCKTYAQTNGYAVTNIFSDDGSGISRERPAFDTMLKFLDAHREEEYRVLIADPQRLARDARVFLELRSRILDAGGTLEVAERLPLLTERQSKAPRLPDWEHER